MAIEALLFDLGKVLVDFDFELGMRHFAARSALSREEFERVILDREWLRRYETGAISSVDYHRYLRESGELEMSIEEFHDAWSAVFLPEPIMPEALLATLKARYPLILVSNTNESHATYIAKKYSIFEYFDHRILSHEVGSMKPDRKIYDVAIAASGKPPEALFFTDDRAENVESASKLGIQAHHFRTVQELLTALKDSGVDTYGF
jgi:putative hydrolase of the HAD superfamily